MLRMTKLLPTIGRVFTPAAMLVFLTYEIAASQQADGFWSLAILVGAALTAVGIEAVGIMSGHTLEGYWRRGDRQRAAVALMLLIVYTGAGLYILWGNRPLLPVPIIAMVVYLVAALSDSLESDIEREERTSSSKLEFDLEQESADRRAQRELELEKVRLQAEVEKERIRAEGQKATDTDRSRTDSVSNNGKLPSDWRRLTTEQKMKITNVPPERLIEMAGISRRTADRWHDRLSSNGQTE